MHAIGPVEMAVGLLILVGYTRLGGYVAAIWLGAIALNLMTTGRAAASRSTGRRQTIPA